MCVMTKLQFVKFDHALINLLNIDVSVDSWAVRESSFLHALRQDGALQSSIVLFTNDIDTATIYVSDEQFNTAIRTQDAGNITIHGTADNEKLVSLLCYKYTCDLDAGLQLHSAVRFSRHGEFTCHLFIVQGSMLAHVHIDNEEINTAILAHSIVRVKHAERFLHENRRQILLAQCKIAQYENVCSIQEFMGLALKITYCACHTLSVSLQTNSTEARQLAILISEKFHMTTNTSIVHDSAQESLIQVIQNLVKD